MIVPFDCPACGARIEAEMKGLKRRVVTCTSCNEQVQVPDDVGIGPGVVIGNGYRLDEKLGDSSLGENFLATREGRQFTVEVLSGETSRDQEKVTRLMQETDLVAQLKHPNIVEAVEAGQDSETYFLVTAYEPGQPLDQYLKANGPLTSGEALDICIDIAEALQYAWEEKRILHRDIKPQNIFVTESGEARLMGFGIAKSSEGQSLGLTGVGFTIGTPEYMSPEQIRADDDLDFRSDLYALGIVLYECVVGELPFNETAPMLLIQKHMDEIPEPAIDRNPDVTPACSALIDKMLLKDRNDRHGSWQELINEMTQAKDSDGKVLASSPSVRAGHAPAPAPVAAGGNNKALLILVGAGIGVVVILLLVLILVAALR